MQTDQMTFEGRPELNIVSRSAAPAGRISWGCCMRGWLVYDVAGFRSRWRRRRAAAFSCSHGHGTAARRARCSRGCEIHAREESPPLAAGILERLENPPAGAVRHSDGASIALIHSRDPRARLRESLRLHPMSRWQIYGAQHAARRTHNEDGFAYADESPSPGRRFGLWGWNRIWLRPGHSAAGNIEDLMPSIRCPYPRDTGGGRWNMERWSRCENRTLGSRLETPACRNAAIRLIEITAGVLSGRPGIHLGVTARARKPYPAIAPGIADERAAPPHNPSRHMPRSNHARAAPIRRRSLTCKPGDKIQRCTRSAG